MKEILLGGTQVVGAIAIVDDEDYKLVSAYRWYAQPDHNAIYAQRRANKACPFRNMHRLILGVTDKKVLVDHKNGNGLDNRRDNLRIATPQQNAVNTRFVKDYGFRGVCWHKRHGKYIACVKVNGYMHYLGYFTDEVEAARAYDKAAKQYFGEFARLNFPDDSKCNFPEEKAA